VRRCTLATNRYQIGLLTVLLLVLLRVSIGFHFYKEGVGKLNNPDFTSKYFFRAARGPTAEYFHSLAPYYQDWNTLLAQPRQANQELTEEERGKLADWEKKRAAAIKRAKENEQDPPVMIPPLEPYTAWGREVAGSWESYLSDFIETASLDDQQAKQAASTFTDYKAQLLRYLENREEEIAEYQHELYRLEQWKSQESAYEVPYQQQRIAQKRAELSSVPRDWVDDVQVMEIAYKQDLRKLLDEEQRQSASQLDEPTMAERVDRWLPYFDITVGVLLVFGLFSRLAALGAGLFLASVVATQLWWLPFTGGVYGQGDTVHYQVVEMFAALALVTVPGRWGGLDVFVYWLFSGCCRTKQ